MVESEAPLPWLRTVVFSVKRAPAAGALVSTVGGSTTKSGAGAAPTVTATDSEQLLVVSDSPDTASTHGAVVVRPGRGRSRHADRLGTTPRRVKSRYTEYVPNLCVPGRDRRVGGLVVAQRGRTPNDPLPWLRTVAFSVKDAPAAGALVSTVGVSTTRSGAGAAPTVTVTAAEQLLAVSDSPDTASTHAP